MTEPTHKPTKRHPLTWVPSLYFNQGLPNTVVREMGNLFFIAMNVPAQALGIFLGMFQLSWAFKFIWSPLVEMFGTKRGWIRLAQGALALVFVYLVIVAARPHTSQEISLRFPMLEMYSQYSKYAMAFFTLGVLAILFSAAFALDNKRSSTTRALCAGLAGITLVLFIIFRTQIFMAPTVTISNTVWSVFLVLLVIAFLSATQDIAIDGYYLDALTPKDQAAYSGVRVMFFRIAMLVGGGTLVMLGAKRGWPYAFGIGAALFGFFYLYHFIILPPAPKPVRSAGANAPRVTFSEAFSSYLDQKRIILILLFVILFRIDDNFWVPMSKIFLANIGVTVKQLGFLQGYLGVIGAIIGGLAGGFYVAKRGLTRSLWVLGIIQSTNLLLYAWLAFAYPVIKDGSAIAGTRLIHITLFGAHNVHLGLIHVAVINVLENMSIGLGTIAFVNFIMRTCKKEYTAAHYAIATGLMALSSMVANFFSGFLAVELGWLKYFIFCFIAALPGLVVLAFLPLRELEARAAAE